MWGCDVILNNTVWVNYNDLNQRPKPIDDGVDIGESSPFMAELFRLVKYYNLPRCRTVLSKTASVERWLLFVLSVEKYGPTSQ